MTLTEVKHILEIIMSYRGDRKYIGKTELEALRIALGCVETCQRLKAEVDAQYWDEYEVR